MDWYENKREFIEWFNGQLIVEMGEMEFHIDNEKKDAMIQNFIDQCAHIMPYEEFSIFYQFVKANKETFFTNLVSNEVLTFGKPINKGMRLSKAFKFFIKDKELLNRVQQLASSYIQKEKVHGVLCLSVHPLDYLSASETTYNWRSCHALDGEYRAGNLSYMTDTSTICCYIRGEENVWLPNFPPYLKWNAKKWRMWIHLSEDWRYCFLGRQYPFNLSNITKIIQEKLPGQFTPFTDLSLSNIKDEDNDTLYTLNEDYIVLNTVSGFRLFPKREVVKKGSELNYNDVLCSSCYEPYYASRKWIDHELKPRVVIGHNVDCLYCNTQSISAGEGLMLCDDCAEKLGLADEGKIMCSHCGEYCHEDDISYLANGDPVCESCLSNGDFAYCADCNEWFYVEDMIWSEMEREYYCKHCFATIYEDEKVYRKEHNIDFEDEEKDYLMWKKNPFN